MSKKIFLDFFNNGSNFVSKKLVFVKIIILEQSGIHHGGLSFHLLQSHPKMSHYLSLFSVLIFEGGFLPEADQSLCNLSGPLSFKLATWLLISDCKIGAILNKWLAFIYICAE